MNVSNVKPEFKNELRYEHDVSELIEQKIKNSSEFKLFVDVIFDLVDYNAWNHFSGSYERFLAALITHFTEKLQSLVYSSCLAMRRYPKGKVYDEDTDEWF